MIFDDDVEIEAVFFYHYFLPYVERNNEKCIYVHYDGKESVYDYIQRKKDIDVITDNGKRNISYSLKTVREVYPYLFIETISNTTKNTPGWGLYCCADYIVYTMGYPTRIKCYRFPRESIKHLELMDGRYKKGYGETRDHSGMLLYRTEGRLIPPEDIVSLKRITL